MSVQSVVYGNHNKWGKRNAQFATGYLFVLPALTLYLLFVFYPFVRSFFLSLTDWNGADATKTFVGFDNYVKLFSDRVFWLSLQHNLLWMVVVTIGSISVGLFLAILLWQKPFGFLFFRTVFFLPQILGDAILAIIWRLIFQPRRGVLFELAKALEIDWLRASPLADPQKAIWAVMIACIWASVGFYFVIFLAGLQNVDRDLIDAAEIDGANPTQSFYHIIVPQLSHVLTLVTVLALIAGIKQFGIIWAMTQGGPANGTEVIATYAYRKFSSLSQVGSSAALTMVMAFLALTITILFIRLREGRVGKNE